MIKLNLVQGFPLAKASSVAYGTRSKGHGKNDNLACGETLIKCSLKKVFANVHWKKVFKCSLEKSVFKSSVENVTDKQEGKRIS